MKTTPIAQDDKSRDKTRRPRRTASLASTPASSSTRKRGHAVLEVSNDESPISTKEQLRSRKRSNTEENIMREGMREGVRTRATLQKDVVLAMPETSLSRPAKRRSIDSPKHAKSRLLKLIYKSKSGEVDADSTACAQPPTSAPASDAATQQPSSACPAGVNGSTSLTPPASSTQESSSLSSPEQARSHSFAEKRPLDTEQRLQQLRAWAEDKHYLSEDDRRDLRAWAGFIIKRDIGVMKGRIKHHDKYNRALEYLGFDREGRVTVRVTVDVSHD